MWPICFIFDSSHTEIAVAAKSSDQRGLAMVSTNPLLGEVCIMLVIQEHKSYLFVVIHTSLSSVTDDLSTGSQKVQL
jgi:hypothetical protein